MSDKKHSIYWFRKALRIHDNPALNYAFENSSKCFPIFIIDPYFKSLEIGNIRWRFLIESLQDLNQNLRKHGSRLYVLNGTPKDVIQKITKEWDINLLCFEKDTEPYSRSRDEIIKNECKKNRIEIFEYSSHTLYDMDVLYERNNKKVSTTYQSFLGLLKKIGPPEKDIEFTHLLKSNENTNDDMSDYGVPSLDELGINISDKSKYPGGESEGLRRLEMKLKNKEWVRSFQKPATSPNSIDPSTTVLSPYLKFGCISVRKFYHKLIEIYGKHNHTQPPVSLEGQLLWREFFYFNGRFIPNFDKIEGNPICRKIKWDENDEFLDAWKNAKTGYPFIDAIMTQLREEGWIHHLARHAVACFLTRGDLYLSWMRGQEVFNELLIDGDWSLNAGNWLWLSSSAFFHQYFRIYSPIGFGKKTDKNGDYIRKYVKVLKNFPAKYIYEPWKAPLNIQKMHGCIIGKDYPNPIVDHSVVSRKNIERLKKEYSKSSKL